MGRGTNWAAIFLIAVGLLLAISAMSVLLERIAALRIDARDVSLPAAMTQRLPLVLAAFATYRGVRFGQHDRVGVFLLATMWLLG